MNYLRNGAIILIVSGLILALIALLHMAPAQSYPAMPDPALTPGAALDTDPTVICAPGYARAHRVWHDKRGTAAKYGIPWSAAVTMEDDDLVPIGLGGNNADPRNHWLQQCLAWENIHNGIRECTAGEAWEKDKLEHQWEQKLHAACRAGDMILAKQILDAGHHFFLSGQWAQAIHLKDTLP